MKPRKSQHLTGQVHRLQRIPRRRKHSYFLRLYVTGASAQSVRALINIKEICEEHLKARYFLEVIDVYQQPLLAKEAQIIAAPTLIKHLPLPVRRFIGDMSQRDRVILGLDLIGQQRNV